MPYKSYIKDVGDLPTQLPDVASSSIMDMFSLKGKVASVTGSSAGIGYAVAEAFAQAGADVAIWYNNRPADDKAKLLAEKYNVKAAAYKCPIDDSEAVKNTIEQIEKDFGTIDIFVANAGVAWTTGSIMDEESTEEEYRKVMSCNVDGVYYCAKNVGKIFKKNKKGSFIITASMSAHIVNYPQIQSPYNASKAAVLHLAKSLAVEFAGFARVNTVSPGYILTELTDFIEEDLKAKWWSIIPMGREGLPKELAGAYLYLASDASSYTTGSDIVVDGGYTIV